jgi:toxin ParE1/3/4
VADLQLSLSAKADLLRIGIYTLETWGAAQAERYLGDLERCAKMLSESPSLGRPCARIRPGLRRFEKGRHVLFFRPLADGILVSRILHHGMTPDEHSFEDDPPEV